MFVYIVDYINRFSYIELTLHPWDEAYSIVVNDGFEVFLDSVCKNLIEYFYIKIHKGDWTEVLFVLFRSLRGLGIRVIVAS